MSAALLILAGALVGGLVGRLVAMRQIQRRRAAASEWFEERLRAMADGDMGDVSEIVAEPIDVLQITAEPIDCSVIRWGP